MYQSFYPVPFDSLFNIQGQAVWPLVELTHSVFLHNIQSSWDYSELRWGGSGCRYLIWMHCSSSLRKWPHRWCRHRQWGSPGEGLQLWSWTTFTSEQMQLKNTSSGWTAAGTWTLSSKWDWFRCRQLAEKLLWLKKPSLFRSAAFCPSAIAGEFVWAQRDSSAGSLIGFPVLQPREIKNWDEGVGRQDELLYCTLKYLWDTFDKYNLTET